MSKEIKISQIFGNLSKSGSGAAAKGAAGAASKGATGAAAKGAAKGGVPIADIIEGVGKIGVQFADASKRRQMDFGFNQQRLQQELGIAEMSAKQAGEIARLNFLAQQTAAGAKPKGTNNSMKTLVIIVSVIGVTALGVVGYLAIRK